MKNKVCKFRLYFYLGFFFCIFIIAAEKGVSDNLHEDSFANGNNDYQEAYNLFLKAKVSDGKKYSYKPVLSRLTEVMRKTKNKEIRLKCMWLICFCYFLDDSNSEAYNSALNAMKSTIVARGNSSEIILLKKIGAAVKNRDKGKALQLLSQFQHSSGKSSSLPVKQLFSLNESRQKYRKEAVRCWQKYYKQKFDKKMEAIEKKIKGQITAQEMKQIRKELEKKYQRKGFFLSESELEASYADVLFKLQK